MKTTLVVLAAGMGSRYGGLKQMDPMGPNGEVILEYSVYDAIQAGFDHVVFIIKKAIEKDFKAMIGDKISKYVEVDYVLQELDVLPEDYSIPEQRVKPLGTAHALYCCKDVLDGPFAVINSDDYYGQACYKELVNFLNNEADDGHYAMVGYVLENTLSEQGSVARGQCIVENGKLVNVVERTKIERHNEKIEYLENDIWHELDAQTLVSMNMWAFTPKIIDEITDKFSTFMNVTLKENPLKGEMYIPSVVGELLIEGKCDVKMLQSKDRWYGVTNPEDKEKVKAGIQSLYDQGCYPEELWK